jgi:hypothetical protein
MKMKMSNKLAMLVISATLLTLSASAQFNTTGTTSVTVTVAAEGSLEVNTATTALANVGTIFNAYTGTTNLTYKIRTTKTGGTGSITLEVTSDFSPANGPSVATPPTAGDALTYVCTVSAPGTACTGTVTSSTSAATSVATFGTNAHSANAGNTGSVAWSLTDDPTYQTGAYSATVTFTIAAA